VPAYGQEIEDTLNRDRDNVIIFALVLLAIIADRASFALGRFFTWIDLTAIAAALLVFSGRLKSAYAAALIPAAVDDILFMPYFGLNFLSAAFYVSAVWYMSENFYKNNYVTRIFIVAASKAAAAVVYAVLVTVFIWGWKAHYVSPQALPEAVFTSAAAAVVFRLAEFRWKGRLRWPGRT